MNPSSAALVSPTSPSEPAERAAPPPVYALWASSWRWTILLVLAVAAARLAYLALWCPYTLAEDEAHYWEWSRHPGWSYYSKGPGVAWVIWLSTRLLGSTEWTVRLPVVVFSAVGALAVAGLARDVSGDKRVGYFAAACFILVPVYQVSGLLMTIDTPYVACWALACWAAWRAFERGSRWAWIGLGAALGAGFLFKYTILLLLPGLILYVFLRPKRVAAERPHAIWIFAGVLVAASALLTVVIWNAQNGWPTVHHLLGHLGIRGGDRPVSQGSGGWHYDPMWTVAFMGIQVGILAWVLVLGVLGPRRVGWALHDPRRAGRLFLYWCALPVIVFYLAVTLVAEAEGNWAMGGYATVMALAGWAAVDGMDYYRLRVARWRARPERPRRKEGFFRRMPENPRQFSWHFAVGTGLIVAAGSLNMNWLASLPGIGPYVPVGRLTGADVSADDVQRRMQELAAGTGLEPFCIAQQYGLASQMAFYLPGHPTVYCSSSLMAGRRTQYDYWPQTDLRNPDTAATLRGRPAVLLGGTEEQWRQAFDRVESIGRLEGDHKKDRTAFLGFGYRGWP
jgi:hypothetical protein